MKNNIKALILFLFAICWFMQANSHVTHKEVKAAKHKYIHENKPDLKQMDSLYWRGLKAIRHDQKFWIKKR